MDVTVFISVKSNTEDPVEDVDGVMYSAIILYMNSEISSDDIGIGDNGEGLYGGGGKGACIIRVVSVGAVYDSTVKLRRVERFEDSMIVIEFSAYVTSV